jgi:hypothetical protein
MARVWAHSHRKDGELLVMLALADFANDGGECWPSIPVLAQKARLTERQTRRVLRTLEEVGEIRTSHSRGGRNRRNRYLITVPENPDNITLKELQGKNNPVIGDTETLTPVSGALNRHRTVNKESDAKASVRSSPISKKRKLTRPAPDPAQLEAFSKFYEVYPRHVARQAALNAWSELSPDAELTATIMTAVARYADQVNDTEQRFILHPASWLNQARWTDEPATGNGNGHAVPQFKDLGGGMVEADGVRMERKTYELRYGNGRAS